MNDRSHGADTIAGPSLAPRLEVTRGEQQGESFKLKLKTRLGRERDNEIVLVDPKVSRYHAQISLERSRWVISDLGSANGTYLNGQVILTSLALEPGDTIALGDTSLVFRLPEAAEEAQAITRPATVQAPLAAAPARPAESRVDTRRLIWIAGGLILVLLLAVAGILTLLRQDDRAAGETAAPLSTSVSRAVNANWELVYEDDFSDSDSGWDDSFDKFTTKQYGNLKYHIEVNDSNLWARGLANRNVGDFELEVEATQEAGPTNNGYGLLFRFQDRNNFYRFDVSGDGFFLLSKFQDGEWITLQDWTAHPAIKQGMTTNLLKVLAVGPDISVFANGQELTRVRDDAFANGNFGFFASTFSEPKLWVSFDNLKLWAPSGTEIAILPTATPTRLAPEATATPTTPAIAQASLEPTGEAATEERPAEATATAGVEETTSLEATPVEATAEETPTLSSAPTPAEASVPTPEALPDYASRDQPLGRGQEALGGRLFFPVYDEARGTYNIFQANADGSGRRLVQTEASQPSLNDAGDLIAFRSWQADRRGLISRPLSGGDPWRFVIFFEAARPIWGAGNEFFLYHSRESGEIPAIYRTVGEIGEVLRRDGAPIQGESPDWLPDGRFVYRGCFNGCGLIISNLDGSFPVMLTTHASDTAPAVSPDGSQIAFMSQRDGNWEVYVIDVDGQNLTRLTNEPENDGLPTWSPDGNHVAFVSDRDGEWEMWAATPGGEDPRVLFPLGGPIDGVVQVDVANSRGWTEERIDWVP